MSFVIDGSEWKFDGWTNDQISDAIDNILERLLIAEEAGQKVWIGDDFQTREMLDGADIWSLCSPDHPIKLRPEIAYELAARLGSIMRYADEELPADLLDATDIGVNTGVLEENLDLAWAHHNVRAQKAVGCIGIKRRGINSTVSKFGIVNLHWVHDDLSTLQFWRAAIDVERDTAETLERLSVHAFPDLFFVPGVWAGLASFSDGYTPIRSEVRRYLSVLNDLGRWIFTSPPPSLAPDDTIVAEIGASITNQLIIDRFSYQLVDFSPEKKSVRVRDVSRRTREVAIGDRILYCEWHGKFERHQNRVYIHPPVAESDEKVVIAVFNRHL